jgi:hypothetical protein
MLDDEKKSPIEEEERYRHKIAQKINVEATIVEGYMEWFSPVAKSYASFYN